MGLNCTAPAARWAALLLLLALIGCGALALVSLLCGTPAGAASDLQQSFNGTVFQGGQVGAESNLPLAHRTLSALAIEAELEQLAAGRRARRWSLANVEDAGTDKHHHAGDRTGEGSNANNKRLLGKRLVGGRGERRPILNEFSFPPNLVQGMRFVLMCQVLDSGGDLPVQVKWFKDKQELSEAARLQEEQVELVAGDELLGATLLFRRVQPSNAGNYTCLATNQFGSSSYSSQMSVKVPPSWKVEPQDQESIMGEQLTMDCQAFGNPNPFIRWKFAAIQQQAPADGGEKQQPRHLLLTNTDNNPEPIISDSSGANNNDNNNWNGHSVSTLERYSQQQLGFKLINSNHHVQTLENGSLTIRQASKEHEGIYLCEADNGVEPSLMKSVRLVVHLQAQFADEIQVLELVGAGIGGELANTNEALQKQQMAAKVRASSGAGGGPGVSVARSVRVMHNSSQVRLLCQPFGDPPLALDWLKDGQLIYTHSPPMPPGGDHLSSSSSSSSPGSSLSAAGPAFLHQQAPRYQVSTRRSSARPANGLESELVVAAPGGLRRSDAGLYGCVARNAYGQAERRLRLVLQEPPEAPEVVDLGHISSRSIGLRWLAPYDGNSPILKYIVEYRRSDPSSPGDQELASNLPPPGHSEKIMPFKGSESGGGSQLAPPGSSLAKLYASPEPPASGANPPPALQQPVQHTVHELEPLTRYSMRVVAVNAIGRSRPSVALSLRTEEEVPSVVPSQVEVLVLSSKSIKLHWSITYSPAREIIDGFFVGYRSLEAPQPLAPLESALDTLVAPPGGGVSNHRFQGASSRPLESGAAAASGNGQSAPTSELQSQQQQQPTFTYKTIRLTNQASRGATQSGGTEASDSQATLADARLVHNEQQQQQIHDPSSAFLSSVSSMTKSVPSSLGPIMSSSAAGQQQQQMLVVSTFEYVIGALERNTEYTILIQCFNKKGAGPTSDPVVFKTFMNDPPEKLVLGADEVTESSVRLSWRPIIVPASHLNPSQLMAGPQAKSGEPVDGYVLTFAKLASQRTRGKSSSSLSASKAYLETLPGSEAPKEALNQSAAAMMMMSQRTGGALGAAEQWQALQMAPQQRSHQLKNLECGTTYAMKIWAFNKIGKGEPSDLLTISTSGKAPVAPDRRSFMAVNSSQVRLHLSAWYDGGCEIDRFIVQYRVRGQSEWTLVSNNILKEQLSVLIRDLQPATSYELLVLAQNQVGPTEVKYRFTTLDSNGRPAVSTGHSFLSSSSSGDEEMNAAVSADADGNESADYGDETGSRRSLWSPGGDSAAYYGGKWLATFRHLLNSPLALILSLFVLVALIFLLMMYRLNGISTQSNETLTTASSSSKSTNGNGAQMRVNLPPGGGAPPSNAESVCETNTVIMEADCMGGPMYGTIMESPRLHLQANSGPSNRLYAQLLGPECHYQPFCAPTNGGGGAAPAGHTGTLNHQHHQLEHAKNGGEIYEQNLAALRHQADQCSPYGPHNTGTYANHRLANNNSYGPAIQRSATMEPGAASGGGTLARLSQQPVKDSQQEQQQQEQHCLMQMLMIGGVNACN